MKHSIIILLLAAISLSKGQAQVHTGMGLGTDFRHVVSTINVGYEFSQVVVEAEVTPSVTRNVDTHNYIGLKAGYNFGGIIPSIGYYYDHVSSDNPALNAAYIGYSLKAYKMLNDRGGLFINGLYIHNNFILTAGIHYLFN